MSVLHGWNRVLVIVGIVGLLVGAIDPLEGSLLILPASVLLTIGVHRANGELRTRRLVVIGLALIGVGFTAMWIITALGGVGGSTDRSAWWALLALPIVPGWLPCVAGGVLALRERV